MAITFTTALDLKSNRITNVGTPTAAQDAVTKEYVDNIATGLVWKDAVRVASGTNINAGSPPAAIDGVTLANNNRVLLYGQTNAIENGIYRYNGTALVRASDADTSAELRPGTAVTVSEGTVNGNRTYVLITDDPISIGTTPLQFALLNAGTAQTYTGGNGISILANVIAAVPATDSGIAISVNGIAAVADTANGIAITTSGIGIKRDPAGGLGVGANGIAIAVKSGGGLVADATGLSILTKSGGGLQSDATGSSVKTDPNGGVTVGANGVAVLVDPAGGLATGAAGLKAVAGTGIIVGSTIAIDPAVVPRRFAASVGDGSATSYVVTHNLNTRDVHVSLYSAAAPYDTVHAEFQRTDANTVTVVFGSAPSSGQYRVVIS